MNTDVVVAMLFTSAAQTGVFLYLWGKWERKNRKKKRIHHTPAIARNKIEDFDKSGLAMGKGNKVSVTHNNFPPVTESATLENDNVYRRMCRALDKKDQEIELKNAEIELKNAMLSARDKNNAFRTEEMRRKNKELDRRQKVIDRKEEDIKDMQASVNHLFNQLQQKDTTLQNYHVEFLKQEGEIQTLQQENRALQAQLWEHVRTYMAPIKVLELEKLLGEGRILHRVHHDNNEEPLQGCA